MKHIYTFLALLFVGNVFAQQGFEEQLNELKQKSDKFNVYLNSQTSFDALSEKGQDTQLNFKARQLRLEFRGNINEKIFYRLRHRLNRSNAGASLDNLATATDMIYAGFRLNEKWTLTAGKMCQAWGGFEFDLNPMNIYEYSDFIENMDNFMLGGMLTYAASENHEWNFQITNARNKKFQDIYEGRIPTGVEASDNPLTYIVNWNGSFGKFQTRWAVGLETEAKSNYSKMVTLGNKLNFDRFQIALDYMFTHQDIDRLGYASVGSDSGLTYAIALTNVSYNSFILKAEYQPAEKWNIFAKGTFETARCDEKELPTGLGFYDNKRNSYGYFCGVEYMPFADQDLRFFLTYVGRSFDYAKNNALNHNTNRISVGMMYRIKAF